MTGKARTARLRGSGAGRRGPASDRAGVWGGAHVSWCRGRTPAARSIRAAASRRTGDELVHRRLVENLATNIDQHRDCAHALTQQTTELDSLS